MACLWIVRYSDFAVLRLKIEKIASVTCGILFIRGDSGDGMGSIISMQETYWLVCYFLHPAPLHPNRLEETELSFSLQEFDDYRDADDAVYELNGKELLGER